jgi:hypothetical protein
MEHEQHQADPDNFAEIWRSAERLRGEEIGGWLAGFFNKQPQLKTPDVGVKYPPGKLAAG